MPEEKKPKIDLKGRLQKMGAGGPAPVAPGPSGIPVPTQNAAPLSSSGVPVPAGIPAPLPSQPAPAALDPSNPLAAVAAPFRGTAAAAPPQPQRIEIDEGAVIQARGAVRKQMAVVAVLLAAATAGVGFVGGSAAEKGNAAAKSKSDAQELAADVAKAKDAMKTLADKVDEGRLMLVRDKKFPSELSKELANINIDFDGSKLAGRRFSGVDLNTTRDLISFITAVDALNEKKKFVQNLLSRLEKPITEELAASENAPPTKFVAVIEKENAAQQGAYIAALVPPFIPSKEKPNLPDKLTVVNPRTGSGNVEVPRYTGGNLPAGPAAFAIIPQTFDRVCPSETLGQIAQLGRQMNGVVTDVRGEKASQEELDPKPGLLDRADRLIAGLNKVQ